MAYVKVRIQFVEKCSAIAIAKLMYRYIGTMRVKIYHNQSILQIINNTDETFHYTSQLPWELLISDPLDTTILQNM